MAGPPTRSRPARSRAAAPARSAASRSAGRRRARARSARSAAARSPAAHKRPDEHGVIARLEVAPGRPVTASPAALAVPGVDGHLGGHDLDEGPDIGVDLTRGHRRRLGDRSAAAAASPARTQQPRHRRVPVERADAAPLRSVPARTSSSASAQRPARNRASMAQALEVRSEAALEPVLPGRLDPGRSPRRPHRPGDRRRSGGRRGWRWRRPGCRSSPCSSPIRRASSSSRMPASMSPSDTRSWPRFERARASSRTAPTATAHSIASSHTRRDSP